MPLTRFKLSAIADGGIDTDELADGSVTNPKIGNASVTSEKVDNLFENTEISGTEAVRVPVGTTAQRTSAKVGDLRYNTDTDSLEYYNGAWVTVTSPPTVFSISPSSIDSTSASFDITITGDNFSSPLSVIAIGQDSSEISASSVTVNSSTEAVATFDGTAFDSDQENYSIQVTTGGLSGTLNNSLAVDESPVWSTSSGSLGTISDTDTGTHFTLVATDPEGESITYTETTSNLSGAGLTLNSSTGEISGDPTDVSSSTTVSFTVSASDGVVSSSRNFSITVDPSNDGTTAARAARSCKELLDNGYTSDGLYYVTNHGTISAEQHYCLMDNTYDGGGWTLLLTMTHGNDNFSGSINPFTAAGSVGSPSLSNVYTRDRSNTFTPTDNDQFMIKRESDDDWVRFVIGTGGWVAGSSWFILTDGHADFANGQTYNSSGSALTNYTNFNCCNYGGNCGSGGGDGCGFGVYNSWSSCEDGTYGFGYNDQSQGGSPMCWGQGNYITDVITTWYRKDGTQ